MGRLINADEIRWADHYDPDGNLSKYKVAYSDEMPPAVDAVPVDFIRSEIERMKEGNNRYYSECEAYAEDLDILLMEWERRKNETD